MNPSATLEYLERMGAKVDPRALRAPDISALVAPQGNPCAWEDREGRPVPPDLEFYRVEVMPGPQGGVWAEQVVRAKTAEGFTKLEGDHGFRMRGCHSPGAEIVLVRTSEVAEVIRRAQIAAQKKAKGKKPARTFTPPEGVVGSDMEWQGTRSLEVRGSSPSSDALPPPPGFES